MTAPFEAIRRLTTAITPAIQELLDAHGFAFSRLDAGTNEATANFVASAEERTWELDIARKPDSALRLCLRTTERPMPAITLEIALRPGQEEDRTADMAEAVALAMSLAATAAQMVRPLPEP